jgi:hypothetical protein
MLSRKSNEKGAIIYHENKKDSAERKKFEGIENPKFQKFDVVELPFEIDTNQIFYIETLYNPITHEYFSKNMEKVNKILNFYNNYLEKYEIVFLPNVLDCWTKDTSTLRDIINYNIPKTSLDELEKNLKKITYIQLPNLSSEILNSLNFTGERYNGFLRARNEESEYYTHVEFTYSEINPKSEVELEKQLWHYSYHLQHRSSDICYKKITSSDLESMGLVDELADLQFNYEAHQIAEDVKQKIEFLRKTGFYHLILNGISNELSIQSADYQNNSRTFEIYPQLSRLLVTNENKVILIDYNKEIKLTPLQKALYFLFLRHPEGILFKYMYDYKEELLALYKNLMYFDGWENAVESIKDLTNPTNNSINEKCSRIKEAFISCCDNSIAKYYYITGNRNGGKRVAIESKYVIFENQNISITSSTISITKSKTVEDIKSFEDKITNALEQAKSFLVNKEYRNALLKCNEIIILNPYHYTAYALRAICHGELGNYLQAESDNTYAISINKKATAPYHNRGEDRLMLKKYKESISDFDYYINNIDQSYNESYYLRGIAKMELNMLPSACQDWYIAKELGRSDAESYLIKHRNIKFKKPVIPQKKKS